MRNDAPYTSAIAEDTPGVGDRVTIPGLCKNGSTDGEQRQLAARPELDRTKNPQTTTNRYFNFCLTLPSSCPGGDVTVHGAVRGGVAGGAGGDVGRAGRAHRAPVHQAAAVRRQGTARQEHRAPGHQEYVHCHHIYLTD